LLSQWYLRIKSGHQP